MEIQKKNLSQSESGFFLCKKDKLLINFIIGAMSCAGIIYLFQQCFKCMKAGSQLGQCIGLQICVKIFVKSMLKTRAHIRTLHNHSESDQCLSSLLLKLYNTYSLIT